VRRLSAALAAALVLALAAAALPSTAGATVAIGIGDQKADMFTDPVFAQLGIRYARISVPWNVLDYAWQRDDLDAWIAAAKAAGVQPLVGFGHARGNQRRVLPSPSRFRAEFRRFRARYPSVTTFATWNEANHCGEPTCHRPELVAAYYRQLRRECPSCTIVASEVIDMPNMASWLKAFQKQLGFRPKLWGLHNYLDANRLRTTGTRALLKATDGRVWFTETGGIVARHNKSTVAFEESPAHAKLATQWVFDRLATLSPRITRVYLYNWNAAIDDNWDSALIGPDGTPRPALAVVRHRLALAKAQRAKAGTS
jgi:hypothetical protein